MFINGVVICYVLNVLFLLPSSIHLHYGLFGEKCIKKKCHKFSTRTKENIVVKQTFYRKASKDLRIHTLRVQSASVIQNELKVFVSRESITLTILLI